VSGILVRDGESPVEECFAQIRHILTLCGVTEEHILRQDVYARSDSLMTLVREHLVGVPNVSLINEFDGDSVLEVTTVASVAKPTVVGASRRTSEMLFTDSCISDSGTVDDAIAGALENVVATVQSAGFSASDMVRVDAVVGDPRFGALVSEEVARRLPTASPVVVWRAGSTTRRALVDLAAIAHR
jgi:enamine deaminase RidA (YjgF/YER057c/UK114 family)